MPADDCNCPEGMVGHRETIELIVRGVLRNAAGEILLCRNIRGGYSYLPGGHIEFGEPAAEALIREFLEETGLTIRPVRLLAASENAFGDKKSRTHELNLVFRVELAGPSVAKDNSGAVASLEKKLAFDWVSPGQLAQSDARPTGLMNWLVTAESEGSTSWLSEIPRLGGR